MQIAARSPPARHSNALLTTAAARVDRSISIVKLWSIQREAAFVAVEDDPVSLAPLVRLETTGSSSRREALPGRASFTINEIESLAVEVRSNKRARVESRESRIRPSPGERKRRDVEHNLAACLRRTGTDCKLEQTPGNILSGRRRRSRQPIRQRRDQTTQPCTLFLSDVSFRTLPNWIK